MEIKKKFFLLLTNIEFLVTIKLKNKYNSILMNNNKRARN